MKRHSNVITIWQTSAIKVTQFLKKIYVQKWKMCKKKNLSWVLGVNRKISVPRDHSLASLGKPRDAGQWFSGRIFLSTPHAHDRSLYSLPGSHIIWYIFSCSGSFDLHIVLIGVFRLYTKRPIKWALAHSVDLDQTPQNDRDLLSLHQQQEFL